MLRILSLVLAVLITIIGIFFLTGYNTSEKYTHEITFIVSYSKELAWQELLRIDDIPNRKKDVKSIEILEEYGKLLAWKESLKDGGYRIYRMNKRIEGEYLELELTDSTYGLKGIWAFSIRPSGTDTEITIYEESTLTETIRRGYRVIFDREHDLLVWQKYIKVGLVQALLITP